MNNEPSEHYEQARFISWFRQNHDTLIFAIPNGGARSKSQAGKLRAEGVLSGVWDCFVPEWHLWIEFKRQHTGNLSKDQKAFGHEMLRVGYRCMVAYGCEDGIDQIRNGPRVSWRRVKRVTEKG